MTPFGEKSLREELDHLIRIVRPQIVNAIATAREHGDLKENAEYHAAREQQGFVEGRIKDIKLKLSNAEIVDPKKINSNKVVFSAQVELFDFEKDSAITYTIVGDDEADIELGLLSYRSPVAKALIGKEKGDFVSVSTPKGEKNYEIKKILYK